MNKQNRYNCTATLYSCCKYFQFCFLPIVNEDATDAVIRRLREENAQMKELLAKVLISSSQTDCINIFFFLLNVRFLLLLLCFVRCRDDKKKQTETTTDTQKKQSNLSTYKHELNGNRTCSKYQRICKNRCQMFNAQTIDNCGARDFHK